MVASIAIVLVTLAVVIAFNVASLTRPYALASWVLAAVVIAYSMPELFGQWFGVPSSKYVGFLIQVAMFGMGATLTVQDFIRVGRMPQAVGLGILLQFTVMPITAWLLVTLLTLPTDLAVGVILIGSCPGGVASNVVAYLAKGNVPLSVTMTACSTLMAPFMTPFLLSTFAGTIVDVPFWDMVLEILRIVIGPIVAGLVANRILEYMGWEVCKSERILSIVSSVAICLICGIIVASARGPLIQVGFGFLIVIVVHNLIGYSAGYWGSRLVGMDESTSRTIAIEVGMQNGGMGASLATNILHNTTMALASALFGCWMTIAGSILAAYWRRKPVAVERSDA